MADRIGLDPSDSRSFLFFALVLGDLKSFFSEFSDVFFYELYMVALEVMKYRLSWYLFSLSSR